MAIVTNDWTAKIMGSVCTDGGDAIKPPTGHVFIGFTVLAAATFDAAGGLVAENENTYANTDHAAGDLADGSETSVEGSGGENKKLYESTLCLINYIILYYGKNKKRRSS